MDVIGIGLLAVGGYAAIGAVFAAVFLARGVGAIDPAARNSPGRVRLLWAPGVVALWPVMWSRWRSVRKGARS